MPRLIKLDRPKAVIFDIDGTLTNFEHRQHFIMGKEKNWGAFYAGLEKDLVNENVARLYHWIDKCNQEEIMIITGRPTKYRRETTKWLNSHLNTTIWDGHLFMRPDGEKIEDDLYKERIYREHIEPGYEVTLAIDDRDSVVKMWRSIGIECWQVNYGNF